MPESSHEKKEINKAHKPMMADLADTEKLRCTREKERQLKNDYLACDPEGKAKAKAKGKNRAAVRQCQEMEGAAPESSPSKAARTTSDVQ